MKTILVRFYHPSEVMETAENVSDEEIKKHCFIANKYKDEGSALTAYAETPATWSTLLEDDADVKAFIDEAYKHYKNQDEEWLEMNFT